MSGPAPTCARCGAAPPEHGAALTGSSEHVDGAVRWLCDTCTRAHVREIEARLGEPWWDARAG